jgi:N-ethylmaleimide reductase
VQDYAEAARKAIRAGFDGVEIHGANGYLVDQFLHYHTNHRTDNYGGTAENLARFAFEVVNACGKAIGYERLGIRLSPGAYLHEVEGDERDGQVFKFLLEQLNALNLAYVHTGNTDDAKQFLELNHQRMTQFIRQHYKGNVIASGGYDIETGQAGIENNDFDLIAFGRPFIANHDFIHLAKYQLPLRRYDVAMLNSLD